MGHNLATCNYMSKAEKLEMVHGFQVHVEESQEDVEICEYMDEIDLQDQE